MSTLSAAITASASALVGRTHAHRSGRLEHGQRRVDASADGQPYRRRDVVLRQRSDRVVRRRARPGRRAAGVKVADVVEDQARSADATSRRIPTPTPTASSRCRTSTRRRRWSTCSAPRARIRRISPPSASSATSWPRRWSSDGKRWPSITSPSTLTGVACRRTGAASRRADAAPPAAFADLRRHVDERSSNRRADRPPRPTPRCRACSTSPATCTTR